jgi:hypothetical protein
MTVLSFVRPAGAGNLDRHEIGAGRHTRVGAARGLAVRGDEPGDEGPVTVGVSSPAVGVSRVGEVDAVDHARSEIGEVGVDPGVEDGDGHAGPVDAVRPHRLCPGDRREDAGRVRSGRQASALHHDLQVGRDPQAVASHDRCLARCELGDDTVDDGQIRECDAVSRRYLGGGDRAAAALHDELVRGTRELVSGRGSRLGAAHGSHSQAHDSESQEAPLRLPVTPRH